MDFSRQVTSVQASPRPPFFIRFPHNLGKTDWRTLRLFSACILLATASAFVAGCATSTGTRGSALSIEAESTIPTVPPSPSREEVLHARINAAVIDIQSLIKEYEALLLTLQRMEDARSSQAVLNQLADFLMAETFSYAAGTAHEMATESVVRHFTPESLSVLHSLRPYASVVDFAVRIAEISAKLRQLAQLCEEGAELKKDHEALVHIAFPELARVKALLKEQDIELTIADQEMQELRQLEKEIGSLVNRWSQEESDIEKELTP